MKDAQGHVAIFTFLGCSRLFNAAKINSAYLQTISNINLRGRFHWGGGHINIFQARKHNNVEEKKSWVEK